MLTLYLECTRELVEVRRCSLVRHYWPRSKTELSVDMLVP